MKATNVGPKKKTVEANMIVTIPGKEGFEVLINNQVTNIKDYLQEVGTVTIGVTKNSERDLIAYLKKYAPEKLTAHNKNNRDDNDEMTI